MIKGTMMLTRAAALADRRWYVIDAADQVLGRVASEAAQLLRGKRNPAFTPHLDCGDFVVVINAERIRLTGKKEEQKVYFRHTGYPGGIRTATAGERRQAHPGRLIRDAVEGMLPKNRLGRRLATKLKIYAGADHPHAAQKPTVIDVSGERHG